MPNNEELSEVQDDGIETEANLEETAAADTLKPGSRPEGAASRTASISKIVDALAGMNQETINKFVATIDQIGHEADSIPDGAAAKNKASIDAKEEADVQSLQDVIKEDMTTIFEGEELNEEARTKLAVLFESAVNIKVSQKVVELEEQYAAKFDEEVNTISENLVDNLDAFLNTIIEDWLADNQVAIESALRTELTEEFIDDLRGLFESHYINVPEDKMDVLEELADRIAELEDFANEKLQENEDLRRQVVEAEAEVTFEKMAEGMVLSDVEKLRALAESVEFSTVDEFETKLKVIKESTFSAQKPQNTQAEVLFEEAEAIEEESQAPALKGPMNAYVQTIASSIRK